VTQRPSTPTAEAPTDASPADEPRRAAERVTLHAGPMTALPQRQITETRRPAKQSRGTTGLPRRAATSAPARPRRPTPEDLASGEPICCLVFAPEPNRARWIETELTQVAPAVLESREPRPKITIQLGRRVRTVVYALTKDPPPRPTVLIVDFDAISPGELFELHAIRHDGWTGRLIGLGDVPPDLVTSLEVDDVFTAPFVRDSLLDCVAGTTHAAVTITIPVIPLGEDVF
jgi:hypothetical protein